VSFGDVGEILCHAVPAKPSGVKPRAAIDAG
jgi:hypothetical protein